MSKLYIYTIKDAYINGVEQNNDLIPKLFNNYLIYDLMEPKIKKDHEKGLQLLNQVLTDIKQKFKAAHSDQEMNKFNIYKFLLFEYESETLTKVEFSYINEDNKKHIIDSINIMIEQNQFVNSSDELEIDNFITYLLRAHRTMEYGLYFSFKFANNDDDLFSQIIIGKPPKRYLIYFTEFTNIAQFVHLRKKSLMSDETFSMNVLYANRKWQYGRLLEDSIIFNELDLDNFVSRILHKLTDPEFKDAELICQLPLPHDLFKFVYTNRPLYFKYLKYKKKYLELKKLISGSIY